MNIFKISINGIEKYVARSDKTEQEFALAIGEGLHSQIKVEMFCFDTGNGSLIVPAHRFNDADILIRQIESE